MPTVGAGALRGLARAILEAVGTPAEAAAVVGDSLVDANLAGHDSHGVLRLPGYIASVRVGYVQPAARPVVAGRDGATARIDACRGWGQPAMWLATETAIALAAEYGVGAAAVNRSYHIGRVAPYVEAIGRAGMLGLAMANAGPAVAPFGGYRRLMGTNPIAWAAPRAAGEEPLSFDIATAAIAEGKLRVARAKGERIAPGLVVDAEGRPSEEPDDFYAGGALLPFGGHKGYGFSVLAQIVGRGLAGLDPTDFTGPRGANGPFVLALDVRRFAPLEAFVAQVEAQCAAIAASPPAAGFERVQLPGEPELRMRARRLAEGVPVAERTWDELMGLAAEVGVAVPSPAELTTSLEPG